MSIRCGRRPCRFDRIRVSSSPSSPAALRRCARRLLARGCGTQFAGGSRACCGRAAFHSVHFHHTCSPFRCRRHHTTPLPLLRLPTTLYAGSPEFWFLLTTWWRTFHHPHRTRCTLPLPTHTPTYRATTPTPILLAPAHRGHTDRRAPPAPAPAPTPPPHTPLMPSHAHTHPHHPPAATLPLPPPLHHPCLLPAHPLHAVLGGLPQTLPLAASTCLQVVVRLCWDITYPRAGDAGGDACCSPRVAVCYLPRLNTTGYHILLPLCSPRLFTHRHHRQHHTHTCTHPRTLPHTRFATHLPHCTTHTCRLAGRTTTPAAKTYYTVLPAPPTLLMFLCQPSVRHHPPPPPNYRFAYPTYATTPTYTHHGYRTYLPPHPDDRRTEHHTHHYPTWTLPQFQHHTRLPCGMTPNHHTSTSMFCHSP